MTRLTRRKLLTGAAAAAGSAATLSLLPPNLRKAVADPVRHPGSLKNIEHVVILMQENRSFDHYFGTLQGVRGFDDPAALTLPTGRSVFHQPDPENPDGYLLPFHLDTRRTSAQAIPTTSHSWAVQHESWNNGAMDSFVTAHLQANGSERGPYTMGYYERDDIPFQFALAEAFTLCDRYHCSMLASTTPNRLYLMTGTIDPAGEAGGPMIGNAIPALLQWTTYPERLSEAGVSWHVYQQEDDYGCNVLELFKTFHDSAPGSPLYEHGQTIGPADQFEYDVAHDQLPTVSWIVPTSGQCEHPDFLPAIGADFVASKLEAIAANKDVWAKTVFIMPYDENDGLFDHVPPPTPAPGTPDEFVDGLPIGGGFRVPCFIISPWTVGGYVAQEPFDHTSVLQFLERITGVREPNITDWRRSTFGDLTSALGFSASRPAPGLPATKPQLWRAERQVADLPPVKIPGGDQTPPRQEESRHRSTTTSSAKTTTAAEVSAGAARYSTSRLQELMHDRADYPKGYAHTYFPGVAMAAVQSDFIPQPGVRYAYVGALPTSYVSIVDTSTSKLVHALHAGTSPYGLAATPDGAKVYVTSSGAGDVAVIDTATATVTTNITVGLFPHGVAVSPDGATACVANTGPDTGRGGSRTVSLLDVASDTVRATVKVGLAPMMIAFAPDSRSAYVTCDDALYVVDVARRRVRHSLRDHGRAHGVAVTPDGSEIWLADSRNDAVTVIDAASRRRKQTIATGRNPWNISFAGSEAYVTNSNENTVSVVDAATHDVVATIGTHQVPVGISTSIDGQVWITNNSVTTIQRIDVATHRVVHTIGTGHVGVGGIAIA